MNGQPAKTRVRRDISASNNPIGANKQLSGGYTLVELCVIIAIIGILSAIGTYTYSGWKLQEMNSKAERDIRLISTAIGEYRLNNGVYPPSLSVLPGAPFIDPWGNPYQYLDIADGGPNVSGDCRRDGAYHPLNTDFDLFSMGADGQWQKKITLQYSLDDIIRAKNGEFIGLASDF